MANNNIERLEAQADEFENAADTLESKANADIEQANIALENSRRLRAAAKEMRGKKPKKR